jgi:hypothetical protein
MATAMGMSEEAFHRRYARQIRGRWSLRETKTSRGMDCVFLTTDPEGKAGCRLYGARPAQCRTWPFWPENLESREMWDAVRAQTPCPGMGQGGLVTIDEILERLGETPGDSDL